MTIWGEVEIEVIANVLVTSILQYGLQHISYVLSPNSFKFMSRKMSLLTLMKEKLLPLLRNKSKEMDKNHEYLPTEVTEEDIAHGIVDKHGVMYSEDGIRLLKCNNSRRNMFQMLSRGYHIREGVKLICDRAFSGSKWLKKVTSSDGVIQIGCYAFAFCEGLEELTIPHHVTSIGESAFSNCTNLKELNISEGTTFEGSDTFYACTKLEKVCISLDENSDGLSFIDVIKGVLPQERLSEINIRAYSNPHDVDVTAAKERTIPETEDNGVIYSVDRRHLIECKNKDLTGYKILGGTKVISDCAFQWRTALTLVNIPVTVNTIGERAFWCCEGLQDVIITNSVTHIGDNAFDGCKRIRHIFISCSHEDDKHIILCKFKGMLPRRLRDKIKIVVA